MKKHLFLLPISFVLSNVLLAQTILKGVIRDSSGASLSNSSVQVKGTTIFTIADDNGAFSIAMKTEAPYLLVISAVGFKNQEVLVPGVQSSPLVITLEENSELTELLISSRRRLVSIH